MKITNIGGLDQNPIKVNQVILECPLLTYWDKTRVREKGT